MKEFSVKRIKAWGKRLLREESGQSIAEYVLILFIVVMIAMRVKDILKKNLVRMVERTGEKMEQIADEE
jgi:Flp pilus assembly pilin Flp